MLIEPGMLFVVTRHGVSTTIYFDVSPFLRGEGVGKTVLFEGDVILALGAGKNLNVTFLSKHGIVGYNVLKSTGELRELREFMEQI